MKNLLVGHSYLKILIITHILICQSIGYAFANDYELKVKSISAESVKGGKTFEEKLQSTKKYILDRVKAPPQPDEGKTLSEKQTAILEKYYSVAGLKREKGNIFTSRDYYIFYDPSSLNYIGVIPLRIIMNRNIGDKLDFGYGWCDDTAYVFKILTKQQGIRTRRVFLYSSRNPEHEQHTIAEVLSPDGRWLIVDLDPVHTLDFFNNGKMFSRQDIANNKSIILDDSRRQEFARTEPNTWGQEGYFDMFYNNLATPEEEY